MAVFVGIVIDECCCVNDMICDVFNVILYSNINLGEIRCSLKVFKSWKNLRVKKKIDARNYHLRVWCAIQEKFKSTSKV